MLNMSNKSAFKKMFSMSNGSSFKKMFNMSNNSTFKKRLNKSKEVRNHTALFSHLLLHPNPSGIIYILTV